LPPDLARRRVGVRFDDAIWVDSTRGFSGQSLDVALKARRALERDGLTLEQLLTL
jgi:hypothetical protein